MYVIMVDIQRIYKNSMYIPKTVFVLFIITTISFQTN